MKVNMNFVKILKVIKVTSKFQKLLNLLQSNKFEHLSKATKYL